MDLKLITSHAADNMVSARICWQSIGKCSVRDLHAQVAVRHCRYTAQVTPDPFCHMVLENNMPSSSRHLKFHVHKIGPQLMQLHYLELLLYQ